MLFKGGWCDLEYWSGSPSDEPVVEASDTLMTSPSRGSGTCSIASSTFPLIADWPATSCNIAESAARLAAALSAAEAERLRVSFLAPGAVAGGLARCWKRFVAPAPPCVLAIYVQQKLGHATPIGILKADRLPDPGICRFPRFGVLIELIERA